MEVEIKKIKQSPNFGIFWQCVYKTRGTLTIPPKVSSLFLM